METSMHTLVTGGAGFIGANLARSLVEHGHSVRVLDDLSTGNMSNLAGVNVDFVEGSVTDPETLSDAIGGAEVVFHQAALPSVPRSVKDPYASHEANATGTLRVLMEAKKQSVRRVVYAASSSSYGNTATLPKQEDMPSKPISPYAVAKLAGENYCQAFSATFGLETVCLRYFNVFGPYQDPTGGYAAVIPKFIYAVLKGTRPRIDGDGLQTRDFTFIDNVVLANRLAALADARSSGQVMNIAAGQRTTVLELLRIIAAVSGKDVDPVHGPGRSGDVRDSWADITKAQELLGYQPVVGLREGLERTFDWYSGQGNDQVGSA
jgi:nucleoside-diphosphate-sugar epimerase